MSNANLHKAYNNKKDEFYTRLPDIEHELNQYNLQTFKNKIVLCNCDDPTYSNFWKFFHMNFSHLKLKKLISTHFNINGNSSYKMEYSSNNLKDDIDLDKGIKTSLQGNGDFRSKECIELLKQADIVVTNPPFSLFREYLAQLIKYNKQFIIWGNNNAVSYKEVFPLIAQGKVWLGYLGNQTCYFKIDNSYTKWDQQFTTKMNDGHKYAKVPAISTFTNIDTDKRHQKLRTVYHWRDRKQKYPDLYPKYDNYNAINIDKVNQIPLDYIGVMGVPITFLNKYNPEQFEILGLSAKYGFGLKSYRFYRAYKETKQDSTFTGASGQKINGNPVLLGKPSRGHYFINTDGRIVHSLYSRIFIKNRYPKNY